MFQLVTPEASFDIRGIIWTNLVEVLKEMLYTKYQSSRPSSFREKEFLNFLSLFNFWLPGLHGPVLTPGASYVQTWYRSTRRCYITNIKALHLLVQEEKIFKFFLLFCYVSNLWPPGQGQFWPQVHHIKKFGRGPLGDATYQLSKLCTF